MNDFNDSQTFVQTARLQPLTPARQIAIMPNAAGVVEPTIYCQYGAASETCAYSIDTGRPFANSSTAPSCPWSAYEATDDVQYLPALKH